METEETRKKILAEIDSPKKGYISHNNYNIDAILESYAKEHAIEFAEHNSQCSDWKKPTKILYEEWINNKE